MSNKTNNIIAADCLTTTTDLPAAFNSLLSNGFSTLSSSSDTVISSSDTVILCNNKNNGFNQRRKYGNGNINNNNGLRNMGRKKQQHTMDSAIFSSTLSSRLPSSLSSRLPSSHLSTPLLFSSPSPPLSLSSSTEIRPARKQRKNKKSRAGTNPRNCATPLSPSAISSCSLASYATTSSGLSSGASSMRTLNDPDNLIIHSSVIIPDSDNTVIKSSSSSAASSAGFGDMTSNDDEDFHERCFYDEPLSLDPMQYNRKWSLPVGMPEIPSHPPPMAPKFKSNNNTKRKNNKFQPKNYNPNISDPAFQQIYFEHYQFTRIIYDQYYAALYSIKQLSSATVYPEGKPKITDRQFSEPKGTTTNFNEYLPHQHLGLPPLPPPPDAITPWLYPIHHHTQASYNMSSSEEQQIIPSACEEAFFNHLKSYPIPKRNTVVVKKSAVESSTMPAMNSDNTKTSILDSPISKTRADFHEQIRERLLLAAATEKISDPSVQQQQTTPIKKQQPHGKDYDKLRCSLSDAAAIAGVSTPPAPQPQGRLSEDQSLFLQSLPLRRPFNSASSSSAAAESQPPPKQFSISYASVIQATTISSPLSTAAGAILPHSKPTPLNALNLPPPFSIGYDNKAAAPTSTTVAPSSKSSSRLGSSSSTTKKSKKGGRTFENRLLSTSSSTTSASGGGNNGNGNNGKRNNNHNKNKNNKIEFCMKDNDFPPISTLSTTSLTKDLSSSLSQKGESGYHSEFSAQCSTADGETDSRCSDLVHRNYSSVVANGSKSCTEFSESKEDTISFIEEDECTSVPEEDDISRMDLLSEHICDYYEQVSQTERTLLRKLRLRDMLYYSLAPLFPVCGLYVVGSSLNGFGNENSDMDLCLVITNGELDQRTTAVHVLLMVEQALSSLSTIQEQTLIRAKVPILRIKFRGIFSDIVVDLNANNLVAVRNTHLLCYYAFFDWRVRPLVTVIKEWAKQSSINDASRSTFTSYSLVLMVLHYLQVLDQPIIPSLQHQFPKRFNHKNDIRTLNLSHPLGDEISSQAKFKRENTASLATLLIGFFHYYACEYDYDKNAISIRLGREVERADVIKDRTQWSPICIEEPFTRLNTAHSIYDVRVFESIKQKFQDAYEILSSTWDLNNLLTVQPRAGPGAAV